MKSLQQIQQDNREAEFLNRHPLIFRDAYAWLQDMADNHDQGDAIGQALANLLYQWSEEPGDTTLTRSQFAAKLAVLYEAEKESRT